MQRFRSGDLTFTAPESWAEVTLEQFLTLTDIESPDDPFFIIATLSGLTEADLRSHKAPFNFGNFVSKHLGFLLDLPEPPTVLPTTLTVEGRTITLPTDLGAEATIGQMWDVELVIREREKQLQPITAPALASVLLPVFLWPMLREEPYANRYQAAELWPTLSKLSCIEALAVSGFFLHNSLLPSNTGKISVVSLPPTAMPLSGWRQMLHRAFRRIRTSIHPSS